MKSTLFSLAIIGTLSLAAQRTDDDVQVKDASNENVIFELNSSVEVCAMPQGTGFYNVHFTGFVKRVDFADGFLAEGSILYNEDLEEVGKTVVEFENVPDSLWDIRRFRDYIQIEIHGQLHKTKFDESTVPELEYESILRLKSRAEQEQRVEQMLENLSFIERNEDDLTFYIKRQTGLAIKYYDNEPFRMMIVLRGGRPYCIVTNNIEFSAPKLKETKENDPYRFYYFQKSRPELHEAITNVMYDYVPL